VKAKNTKIAEKLKKQLRRHIKLTLVPHGANQYRPHLVRRTGLVLITVFVIGLQAAYGTINSGMVFGARQSVSTSVLLDETNQQRNSRQLAALKLDARLSKAASLKAQDMFKQQYWAHTAPDGTTPWKWLGDVGYDYAYAGENLAKDFGSAGAVMTAWMASPDHKANILDKRYTQVGFAVMNGVLDGKEANLVVALFGEPIATGAAVAGANQIGTPAAMGQEMSLWTRIVVAAESFTPAALMGLIILTSASLVATAAHIYRNNLPKKLRRTPYRNHGAYKAIGLVSFAIAIISLYGGGQI